MTYCKNGRRAFASYDAPQKGRTGNGTNSKNCLKRYMVTIMTDNRGSRTPGDAVPRDGGPIRLAQLVWRKNAWQQVPIGPHLIVAMENWLAPIRVYDYYRAPATIREIFARTPVTQRFEANTIVQSGARGPRYIVVYNGRQRRERVWWSRAHEFGHIVLGHALTQGWHDNASKERQAGYVCGRVAVAHGCHSRASPLSDPPNCPRLRDLAGGDPQSIEGPHRRLAIALHNHEY